MWISRALLVAVTRLRLAAARADDRLADTGKVYHSFKVHTSMACIKPHLLRYKKPYITLDTAFLHCIRPYRISRWFRVQGMVGNRPLPTSLRLYCKVSDFGGEGGR